MSTSALNRMGRYNSTFLAVTLVALLSSATRAVDATCATSPNICPFGYKADIAKAESTTETIENCCVQDTDIVSFPACSATLSGGASAIQAPTFDDVSWLLQDNNGFTRTVGKYTGMCFTVLVDDNDCGAASNCCTKKRPSYMQFKLTDAMVTAAKTAKCNLSYGTGVATANGLKRITKWNTAGTAGKFINLPLVWRRNAKTTSVCVYSVYSASNANVCDFETICGLSGEVPAVPDASGNYANGCELRAVGRASATSSACCAPTFSVEAFDSTAENRLAAGGAASSGIIELSGI